MNRYQYNDRIENKVTLATNIKLFSYFVVMYFFGLGFDRNHKASQWISIG